MKVTAGRSFGAVVLLGLATLAVTAGAGETRSVKLVRKAAAVGDSFRSEVATRIEMSVAGAKVARDTVTGKTGYTLSIVEQAAPGRFRARLDVDAEETTVVEDGVAQTTSVPARTVTMEMSEDETRVIPTKGMAAATGSDVLAGRSEVRVGETWTADKKIPLGGVVLVPVHSTYKVVSIEKDERGREVVRIELSSEGVGTVPTSGIQMKVLGTGHALVDAAIADRPVEVKLAYRFVAEGGEGEDLETRTEITIKNTELKACPEPSRRAAAKETAK